MILQNEIECRLCGDIIFSMHGHDFVTCKCGAVSVDGGQAYLKRSGELENIIERSLVLKDRENFSKLVLKCSISTTPEEFRQLVFDTFHQNGSTYKIGDDVSLDRACEKQIRDMIKSRRSCYGVVLGVIRVLRDREVLNKELFQ